MPKVSGARKPGCKCKSGCQGKRCACHQNGASCKTDQCGCKATCSNPINAFSFIFGPGNEPEEVHPCFLTWILGKQQEQQKEVKKKKKKVSLREIWEREEPRIWDECMRADYDALWSSSDDMKQNARDFKSLPEDKQDSFKREVYKDLFASYGRAYYFYSFCEDRVQFRENWYHCKVCKTCSPWRVWHCDKCNKCTYGVTLPCGNCASHGEISVSGMCDWEEYQFKPPSPLSFSVADMLVQN